MESLTKWWSSLSPEQMWAALLGLTVLILGIVGFIRWWSIEPQSHLVARYYLMVALKRLQKAGMTISDQALEEQLRDLYYLLLSSLPSRARGLLAMVGIDNFVALGLRIWHDLLTFDIPLPDLPVEMLDRSEPTAVERWINSLHAA